MMQEPVGRNMTMRRAELKPMPLKVHVWLACLAFPAVPAAAQETPGADEDMSAPTIARSFGDTGLMARFNSSEQYGAVQARTGLYTAHANVAQAGGVTTGFKDDVTTLVTPVNMIMPLRGLGQGLHIKLGYANILSRGSEGHATQVDNDSQTGLAQLLWLIGDQALIGGGVIHEVSNIGLRHNEGGITTQGTGVRVDMLYRFASNWGASLRISRLSGEADSKIPNARLGVIANRQSFRRTYSEASVVGTYRGAQSAFVPRGWIMRPSAAFIWQDSRFSAGTNNLGTAVASRSEQYMLGTATVRLEQDGFAPWRVRSYGEAGLEQELRNNVAQVDDDPTSLYIKAGAAKNMGGKGRLDLYVARRDSIKGSFQSTTVNLLLSMAF